MLSGFGKCWAGGILGLEARSNVRATPTHEREGRLEEEEGEQHLGTVSNYTKLEGLDLYMKIKTLSLIHI